MTELIAVVTITLLAVISPGPDFAMVSRNSLLLSRRAGIFTACGIGAGVLIHVSYTLIGVGVLIQQSPWLFNLLKGIGAAYLIYLGFTLLRNATHHDAAPTTTPAAISDLAALKTGFLTNALNPKTTIFIVSLFMQVVSPTPRSAYRSAMASLSPPSMYSGSPPSRCCFPRRASMRAFCVCAAASIAPLAGC